MVRLTRSAAASLRNPSSTRINFLQLHASSEPSRPPFAANDIPMRNVTDRISRAF